jgi:hypothetical protein
LSIIDPAPDRSTGHLKQLGAHCRRMAAVTKGSRRQLLQRQHALWIQLADEIDAYLGGDLETTVDDPDQLALDGIMEP